MIARQIGDVYSDAALARKISVDSARLIRLTDFFGVRGLVGAFVRKQKEH